MVEEPERFSLSRWSRRKIDARRVPEEAPAATPVPPEIPAPATAMPAPAAPVAGAPDPVDAAEAPPLAPVESLSLDSDFRPYFGPKVDEQTKRAALRKLFADPHFNVMDGLDVYIDDYNKPDPMPAGMLEKIVGVYERLAEESAAKEAKEKADAAALAAAESSASPPPVVAPAAGDGTSPAAESMPGDAAQLPDPAPDRPLPSLPPAPHAVHERERPEGAGAHGAPREG